MAVELGLRKPVQETLLMVPVVDSEKSSNFWSKPLVPFAVCDCHEPLRAGSVRWLYRTSAEAGSAAAVSSVRAASETSMCFIYLLRNARPVSYTHLRAHETGR